jgi:hypothetical protein
MVHCSWPRRFPPEVRLTARGYDSTVAAKRSLAQQDWSHHQTGPAGGHWRAGDRERITMDAFEFCRALSGRAPAAGLLTTQVPV